MNLTKRIMLIDDDPDDQLLFRDAVNTVRPDLQCELVSSCSEAFKQLEAATPDLIFMDLNMPVMNGFDAAIEIRKIRDPKKANTPIIALTASALFDIKERVFSSGMNDYVSKPFKPDELREKMQNLVTTAIQSKISL